MLGKSRNALGLGFEMLLGISPSLASTSLSGCGLLSPCGGAYGHHNSTLDSSHQNETDLTFPLIQAPHNLRKSSHPGLTWKLSPLSIWSLL